MLYEINFGALISGIYINAILFFLIMLIKTYLNCTEQEIQSKKFNIFVGISLGNKYFTKENIKKYILWALENRQTEAKHLNIS